MRLLNLNLENIGPFDKAELDLRRDGADIPILVTLLTGENGTGKSTLIDAIREVLGDRFRNGAPLRRSVFRAEEGLIRVALKQGERPAETSSVRGNTKLLAHAPWHHFENGSSAPRVQGMPRWVVDYWRSNLDSDSFKISGLTVQDPESFLDDALLGRHRNVDTTALVCHLDYLRDSHDPIEKRDGETLYQAMQRIAEICLLGGRFSHVSRARLEPMFQQRGQLLGIAKLSAGSLYLFQRMLGLLDRMYSCWVVAGRDESISLFDIPGLLLIDEAENHLHPRWQKQLLPSIRELFPNLQLIVATHSPFILASVADARVFVCRAEDERCTVTDVSAAYANKPIDEILLSPAFAETQPFSLEITTLLDRRRQAIRAGDRSTQEQLEQQLLALNHQHFGYLEIDKLLAELHAKADQ